MRQLNALRRRRGPVGSAGAVGNRVGGRPRLIATDAPAAPVARQMHHYPPTPVVIPLLEDTSVPTMHRGYEWIHVSDILYKCSRRVALHRYVSHSMPGGNLSEGQRITFGIGDKIHDMVKESIARSDPSRAFGTWKCHCGKESHTGVLTDALSKAPCVLCHTELTHYHEINITDESRSLVGGIDFLLYDNIAFYLVEIKSIKRSGTSSFEEVQATRRPLPMHSAQALIYWNMLYNAGWPSMTGYRFCTSRRNSPSTRPTLKYRLSLQRCNQLQTRIWLRRKP